MAALCDVGNSSIYYEQSDPKHAHTTKDPAVHTAGNSSAATHSPTLLFVHGVGGAVGSWIAVRAFFSKYDCIYVDLPGHGRSTGAPLTVSENATVLAQFIKQLSLPRVVYVGIYRP